MWRPTALLLTATLASACQVPARGSATVPSGASQAQAGGAADPQPDAPGRINIGGSVVRVEYDGNELPLSNEVMEAWVRRSAQMVRDYLGEFPVPSIEITLVGRGRGGVGFGMHQDGRWITVYCGRRTSPTGLENDWVLVHEMLHAAFPDLARDHRWMQEGLSTYLEPVVRARAGNTTDADVWRRWIRSMHHGRPRSGDRGLDRTHTWGRTYWGGALFWLVADVELRTQTGNKRSVRDVVRGILAEGGNGRANWSTRRVVEVADEVTGTTVVSELYARMAEAPGDVDLDQLLADLGVARVDGETIFDDDAPLAHVRRAITARSP
ncbi:MAG: hypothetical protein AAGF11_22755 [Myxococcota bacterium]